MISASLAATFEKTAADGCGSVLLTVRCDSTCRTTGTISRHSAPALSTAEQTVLTYALKGYGSLWIPDRTGNGITTARMAFFRAVAINSATQDRDLTHPVFL